MIWLIHLNPGFTFIWENGVSISFHQNSHIVKHWRVINHQMKIVTLWNFYIRWRVSSQNCDKSGRELSLMRVSTSCYVCVIHRFVDAFFTIYHVNHPLITRYKFLISMQHAGHDWTSSFLTCSATAATVIMFILPDLNNLLSKGSRLYIYRTVVCGCSILVFCLVYRVSGDGDEKVYRAWEGESAVEAEKTTGT